MNTFTKVLNYYRCLHFAWQMQILKKKTYNSPVLQAQRQLVFDFAIVYVTQYIIFPQLEMQ